jgi:two-component system nitrate/nitrite response regulator NarL
MRSHAGVPIRVMIVDNHNLIRAGLALLVASRPDLTVVGQTAQDTALAVVDREQPHIVVLDLDDSGAERTLERLHAVGRKRGATRVIVLSSTGDKRMLCHALRLGVLGAVWNEQVPEELFTAIRQVHAGKLWLDNISLACVVAGIRDVGLVTKDLPGVRALTRREHEIILVICEGSTNMESAARLGISEATVRHHLTSIYKKLRLANRVELAAYAYRHGLASLPPD